MAIFTKESLETLRQRIDLAELLSSFIDMKRAGASFKAHCPFHDEKTASFHVQKGDSHYHCFGCGAHGDAIAFLMNHQKLSFSDAVEFLADKFQVHLEKTEGEEVKGPPKKEMREALGLACRLYHTLLLHTEEGHRALQYLYKRDLSLEFIKQFEIGFAPARSPALQTLLRAKGISQEVAEAAGLLKGSHDFFADRIMFPIRASSGYVIGFSGRKFKEETSGGKYVNTPETALFKKSRVLYGFNYSRQRIAKERKTLVVEGQIDALRLIYAGLDFTVAGQGTAFGESHVQELVNLGLLKAYLAFDGDTAGKNATAKVGDLFQKEGIDVKVVNMPPGYDPDLFLKEKGPSALLQLIEEAEDYLAFLVRYHAEAIALDSPAGKNELAALLSRQVRGWKHGLMVHESLRKLAHLLQVPESMIGVGHPEISNVYLKKTAYAGHQEVDPDWVIETDVLRWLIKTPHLLSAKLEPEQFKLASCRTLYNLYREAEGQKQPLDFLQLISQLEEGEGQKLLEELTDKKVDLSKAESSVATALQRLLDRNWMLEREAIRIKIQSGSHTDEEALELAKQFEAIKRSPPKLKLCT